MEKVRFYKTKIVFAFAMVLLLSLSLFSYIRISNLLRAADWVNHTNLVKFSLENLSSSLKDVESAGRGFMLTDDAYYMDEYTTARNRIASKLDGLENIIGNNEVQQKNMASLRALVELRLGNLATVLEVGHLNIDKPTKMKFRSNRAALRDQINKMLAEEDLLLRYRTATLTEETTLTPMFMIFLMIAGLVILLASYISITKNEHLLAERNLSLEEKNVSLAKMNKELESFTYISSHDLQEPLRKIQTFVSRILELEAEKLSETAVSYLGRTVDAANRMQNLIRDLLAYSRLKVEIFPVDVVDLKTVIEEVKADLAEELEERGVEVTFRGEANARLIVSQFRQLLTNLFSNSIKFASPDRKPHIFIENSIVRGEDINIDGAMMGRKYYRIVVSDNGVGFDPKYSDRIFKVFQRLHMDESYKGTGIGLAIVKKIVENHHGLISAVGRVNEGATFMIFIPFE